MSKFRPDPAPAQIRNAFRLGDPKFEDADAAARWVALRRRVTDHVLRRIAENSTGDALILRGGRLMKAWFGDQAREPVDLDWVVDPPTISPPETGSTRLRHGLVYPVCAPPYLDGIELDADQVTMHELWSYDRAPGRRLVFPWRAPGLPGGAVHVDVVYGEALAEPARWESIPVADGGCVSIKAASPAQSLAWKLFWLTTDMHPEGKDLYDAVLLAERFPLSLTILEQTLGVAGDGEPGPTVPGPLLSNFRGHEDSDSEWGWFRDEFPWVVGDVDSWLDRLEKALGPTFHRGEVSRARADSPVPSWLTTDVVDLARGIADDRAWDWLPMLSDALEEAGCDRGDLVHHCRAGGPHTLGCWAIDQILGGVRK